MVFGRYINVSGLGYFVELPMANACPEKRASQRPQSNEESVEDLPLDCVLHGREI
jgi:hypothetical protein